MNPMNQYEQSMQFLVIRQYICQKIYLLQCVIFHRGVLLFVSLLFAPVTTNALAACTTSWFIAVMIFELEIQFNFIIYNSCGGFTY